MSFTLEKCEFRAKINRSISLSHGVCQATRILYILKFTYFITHLVCRHPGWNVCVVVKSTWNGVVLDFDRSFHTGKVQSRRGRRTSIEHSTTFSKWQNWKKTSGLGFNFWFMRTLLFGEKFTVFRDQRLFRARSVNLREECFPSEIIHAKICGESHWS